MKLMDANFMTDISFNTTNLSSSDLVLANDGSLITSINRIDDLEDNSDPFPVHMEITVITREPQKKQELCYSPCNYYFG